MNNKKENLLKMCGTGMFEQEKINVTLLKNKVVEEIIYNMKEDENFIYFKTYSGDHYILTHRQDCCEAVYLDDIIGNLNDLIGSPILMSELATNKGALQSKYEKSYSFEEGKKYSQTWSFYKFATLKGYVDIRWNGSSNGCYSEEVDFIALSDETVKKYNL